MLKQEPFGSRLLGIHDFADCRVMESKVITDLSKRVCIVDMCSTDLLIAIAAGLSVQVTEDSLQASATRRASRLSLGQKVIVQQWLHLFKKFGTSKQHLLTLGS